MAFVKKTWKDRIVQYANRRLLTKSGGEVEQVTVTRDEGTVSVVGDKFDAATMNDLENRIDVAISALESGKQDKVAKGYAASLDANNLYGSSMTRTYRNVSSSIAHCPENDGTLFVFSNGDGYSTVQFFINTGATKLYMRSNWGAGSVSWQDWRPIDYYKTDDFPVSAPTNVQLAVNKSHYISNKVVHIFCQVKVTEALSNQPVIQWTPTCNNAGITIPVYCGDGQWSPTNQITYGYLGANGINANVTLTNPWVTIDQIIRLA